MKNISLFLVLLLMVMPWAASAEVMPGDVDGNGKMNISDVTELIDYLLTRDASSIDLGAADVNSDDMVNIVDVTVLIDMILLANVHEYVDLGLPSGTLWATCNVGASSPEESGDYFAWGETEPKDLYSWSNYKWCNGSKNTMTKYCANGLYATFDNKTELDDEDDAAYMNWGVNWCMPTSDQLQELKNNCTWTWTKQNGVNGHLVTGPNGNTLFLPASGDRWDDLLGSAGSAGFFWTRTLYSNFSNHAWSVYFDSQAVNQNIDYRNYGLPVRAVRVPQN